MTASELKKSILQMAVEGKLTEQSEKDEPVEKLLKRIKEEKESLIKEGKIKKEKTISEIYKKDGSYYERVSDSKNILKDACIDEELPFEIPDTWTWVKINSISKSITAGGDKPNNYSEFKTEKFTIPILSNGKENDGLFGYTDIPKIIEPSITISGRGTIGFSCVRRYPYFPIVRLISIIPFNIINLDFIKIVFDVLIEKGVGTSVKQLTVPMLIDKLIPLPPIEEQKRIVEKINLLMPLINEYDELEKSITKLNKEFPDNIKKSILQYAIEGKLTEQSEKDEPAEELLKRIKKEREKLIKEGKIKKDKTTSEIYKKDGSYYERVFEGNNIVKDVCIDDELPFEIPDSWVWVRLGTLVSLVTDGTHKTPQYVDKGIPFLSVQNISKGFFDFTKIKYITEEEHEKLIKRVKPQLNDILICRVGTLGKALKCTLNIEFSIFVSLGLIRLVNINIVDFIILLINSPLGDKWIDYYKIGGGTHTYKINLIDIPKMLFPLPPIEEQKRIVDKINRVNEVINTIKV